MAYKNVQFIAYCINTAPAELESRKEVYLGLPSEKEDIEARIRLVEVAIQKAHESASKDESHLKIFMMPEFFRGPKGAYEMLGSDDYAPDDKDKKYGYADIISGLQSLVLDEKWKDWIFIFGTIVAKSFNEKTPKKEEAYNVSLVQKGGSANSGNARVIMKQHKSNIDFIEAKYIAYDGKRPFGIISERVLHPPIVEPGIERREFSGDPNIERKIVSGDPNFTDFAAGTSIFEMDGIRFGLEVCLDHLESRLKKSVEYKTGRLVDIQLIPSCGMSIKPEAVAVRDGGHVFNCDGINAYFLKGTEAKDQNNPGILLFDYYNKEDEETYSVYDSHSALAIKKAGTSEPTYTKKFERVPISFNTKSLYASGAGQLHIYPLQPLNLELSSASSFSMSFSKEAMFLSGMKVIFDNPVSVYPVTLNNKKRGNDG